MFDIKAPKGLKKMDDKTLMKIINNSMFGDLKKMNSAYFGRNWESGRRWHFSEIQNMTKSIGDWDSDMLNTMMPKIVKELEEYKLKNPNWDKKQENKFRLIV